MFINLEIISDSILDSPQQRTLHTGTVEETYLNTTESKHETVSENPTVKNYAKQNQHDPKQSSEDILSSWKEDL